MRIVHFLGGVKPWHHQCSADGRLAYRPESHHSQEHVHTWWTVFNEDLRQKMENSYIVSWDEFEMGKQQF